ncbi:MAG: DUF2262 domain-containing protein [Myxococcales bacterium]|nr:DUF2262 domain-containing protein [Myxococcales bacterium]
MVKTKGKVVAIEGVADLDRGGGAVKEGRHWRGVVFLRPWRILPDGDSSKALLRVLLPPHLNSGDAVRSSKRLTTGKTYRFSATLQPRRPNRLITSELTGRFVRVQGSSGLGRADKTVSATIRLKDPVLGALIRRARTQTYEGRLKLYGRTVSLLVDEDAIAGASALFAKTSLRFAEVPKFIAKKMLRLANETWLDKPISENEFLRRLKPTEVRVDSKSVCLDFSCGEIFGDHGLVVKLTGRGGIRDVQLQ